MSGTVLGLCATQRFSGTVCSKDGSSGNKGAYSEARSDESKASCQTAELVQASTPLGSVKLTGQARA
jgi:hypothetical protein